MNFKPSAKTTLLIIAGLFFAPLILAWLMWSGIIDFNPANTRNKGELINPPEPVLWDRSLVPVASSGNRSDPVNSIGLEKHWVILHVVPNPCTGPCLDAISGLRQVHKAAGRDRPRIRIVMLMPEDRPAQLEKRLQEIYAPFSLAVDTDGGLTRVLDQIAGTFSSKAQGSSYVADPIGNIMLFYEAGSDPNDLKTDLKRLLTWSKMDK